MRTSARDSSVFIIGYSGALARSPGCDGGHRRPKDRSHTVVTGDGQEPRWGIGPEWPLSLVVLGCELALRRMLFSMDSAWWGACQASNAFGSSRRNTRLKVSWLGVP